MSAPFHEYLIKVKRRIWGQTWESNSGPPAMGSPSQLSQLIRECLYKEKGDVFALANSACAYSDCLSPWSSWPGWVSQGVHLEKVGLARRVTPTLRRGNAATIGDKISWDTWGAFWHFTDFKRGKYSFSSPSPPFNAVLLFKLPLENNKHPNFEWGGAGWGVDAFVLWSYLIWVQCLNNFVADCRRVTLLAESNFCFLCKGFTNFGK